MAEVRTTEYDFKCHYEDDGCVRECTPMCEYVKDGVGPEGCGYSEAVPKPKPAIVCLCGSTRFWEKYLEVGWELTLQGKIVFAVGVCKHAEDHGGEALGQDVADRLDELHKRKIDLSDTVFVLNVGGYIGESTRSEIEYAEKIGKPVEYLEPLVGPDSESVKSAKSADRKGGVS